MIRYQIISTLIILCLTLPLAACLKFNQPRNKIEYYTLEYDPPDAGSHQRLPHVIGVQQFSASPIYSSNRIVYRDESFKRQAYSYHKWWANPAELVTYYLARDLKNSNYFKTVLTAESRFAPSYRVEGSVDDFLELDRQNTWEAVLGVSIVLIDEKQTDISQKILFQKTYRTGKPCEKKNPRSLAKAMSLAMSEISHSIINDIYEFLEHRKN